MKRFLQVGLLSALAIGLVAISASAAPFVPPAAPAEAVSKAEQVQHRHYHKHHHRHYHEHRHYHYGPSVYYTTPAYYVGWYPAYRPYYEFYGLDVAPRFIYPEQRYRIFRHW